MTHTQRLNQLFPGAYPFSPLSVPPTTGVLYTGVLPVDILLKDRTNLESPKGILHPLEHSESRYSISKPSHDMEIEGQIRIGPNPDF
jgi:hypothetical protein